MSHPAAHPRKRIAFFLLATTIPASAQQLAGSQKPAQASDTATLRVTAQLTRVDVTVTDAKGRPIHGLTQSNFTVKEDGKPQPLKHFEELGTDHPAPSEALPQLPPNVYTNAQPQPPATGSVNVLLVDDVTTGSGLIMAPQNVAASRSEAGKYLRTIPAGTQVILLEFSDRLRVIQGLTTDREVLLAALHSITYQQSSRTSIPCTPGAPCHFTPVEACVVFNAQSQAVVEALDDASAFLSGIKGRKNLIWFTPGIPWLTRYLDYSNVVCLRDYTAALQRDYNLLAAAQVALYPVDPSGIAAPFSGRAPGPKDHVSMEDLASATGGQAYYSRNDIDRAIGEAIASGTKYYSLFYVPPLAKYDGQYHKINVQLDRPGLHLDYRKGYTSIDPAMRPQPAQKTSAKDPPPPNAAVSAAISHGAAPSTQMLFTVGVTPSAVSPKPGDPVLGQLDPKLKLKGKSLVRYDFNYRVLPGDITFADAPDGKRQASVDFTVAAYDGQGEMLNVLRQTASFAVEPEKLAAFLQRPFPILLQLDLPPGNIFVRAVVHDASSDKTGSLEIPLTVVR